MNFIIYNAEGKILRTGVCPDEDVSLQPQAGELILEGIADPNADAVDVYNKEIIYGGRTIEPAAPESYASARKKLYPSVEEQLDMLWHAMNSGATTKVEPFFSIIASVKQAVPKQDVVFEVGSI